ncbi:MAG: hypothetical protein KAU01_08805 [Candidatus Cloacimonetes bacterium]|nr:hypothetical protein [Candidatus Cloacimonadota bacterium]
MKKEEKGRLLAGLILIILGLSISGIKFYFGFHQNSFMLLLGGLFIAAYFYKDAYGFLIPGCILAGLGLGSFGHGFFWNFPHFSTLGLGIGFIGIFVIDLLNKGKTHWWPLIPGGILFFTGLSYRPFSIWRFFHIGWPIALIIIGLWIIAKSMGLFKSEEKKNDKQ